MSRRILCYGDSNTYGYDPRSVRWTGLLEAGGRSVISEGKTTGSIP